MRIQTFFSGMMVLLLPALTYAGGVALSTTRVIYPAEKKEASLTVSNNDKKEDFLIQSWVEDASGNKKTPFIVTPPLFQLDHGKDNVLRIVNVGAGLPQDRESVYWLNVKSIPPRSENVNVLQIAVRTRLKLFYRPAGLTGKPLDAEGLLQFRQQGQQLMVTNPSGYNLTLGRVTVNQKELKTLGMVPAKGQLALTLPAASSHAGQVEYTVINDFGAASKPYIHKIQ